MVVKILDTNYESIPPEIVASMELDGSEESQHKSMFISDSIDGQWAIEDFGRGAPSSPLDVSKKYLVSLREMGDCGRLSVGMRLSMLDVKSNVGFD